MSTNKSTVNVINLMDCITTRQLQTKHDIQCAENLLYEVYCKELKWTPLEKNPSDYRIEDSEVGKILTDKYSDESFWIGAFCQDKLIGCCRLLHSQEVKRLEMHEYFDTQVRSELLEATSSVDCEINRLTVHKEFRGKGIVMLKLMRFGFEQLIYGDNLWSNVSNLVSTTTSVPTMKYLKLIGANVVGDFKYHESDLKASNVFVLQCSQTQKMLIVAFVDAYFFYCRMLSLRAKDMLIVAVIVCLIFLFLYFCAIY